MTLNDILDFPDEMICEKSDDKISYSCGLSVLKRDGKVRFCLDLLKTRWLKEDDAFIKRIAFSSLNRSRIKNHIAYEIRIKNDLDESYDILSEKKYPKAIKTLDDIIYYDSNYGEAFLYKSYALYGQGHFVKSLRTYRKALKCDESLRDDDYLKNLMSSANRERDGFLKIKQQIYLGDEHFSKGDYQRAVDFYDKALKNPSGFKDKILYKLLNKKALALCELKRFKDALDCLDKSIEVHPSDLAYFTGGVCRYSLGSDVSDEFKGWLNVDKKRQLGQVRILNALGYSNEARNIGCEILRRHFKRDRLYLELEKQVIK